MYSFWCIIMRRFYQAKWSCRQATYWLALTGYSFLISFFFFFLSPLSLCPFFHFPFLFELWKFRYRNAFNYHQIVFFKCKCVSTSHFNTIFKCNVYVICAHYPMHAVIFSRRDSNFFLKIYIE